MGPGFPRERGAKRAPLLAAVDRIRDVVAAGTEEGERLRTGLFRAAGGGALYRTGVLQRCLRDINAGAQHLMVSDSAYERLGQTLLGFPDVDPMG